MASEILSIPEEKLPEVIRVIREGLKHAKKVSIETRVALANWCDEEEKYLKRLRR